MRVLFDTTGLDFSSEQDEVSTTFSFDLNFFSRDLHELYSVYFKKGSFIWGEGIHRTSLEPEAMRMSLFVTEFDSEETYKDVPLFQILQGFLEVDYEDCLITLTYYEIKSMTVTRPSLKSYYNYNIFIDLPF